MATLAGFPFFTLNCDGDGAIENVSDLQALTGAVTTTNATDVILLGHGFRNDENDARGLYTGFLETFRAHLTRPEFTTLQRRRFVVCGLFWPSKTFKESFDEGAVQALDDAAAEKREVKRRLERMKNDASPAARPRIQRAIELLDEVEDRSSAQDEFVEEVLSLLDGVELDATEGLQKVRSQTGAHLLDLLEAPLILPTTHADQDEGGVHAVGAGTAGGDSGETAGVVSVFGSVFGRIGQFLNLTTWYLMKDRSGKVGTNGCAEAVRAVRAASPDVKVHLVGHSLGGRLMASCAKALAEEGRQKVDSLTLLQAAFSHYGLSNSRRGNKPGFFRAIVDKAVVKGPFISTYSAKDTVVGKAYAIMSRLANDNVKAIGDENDEYGGIGRNGAQNAQRSIIEPLHTSGTKYDFSPGVITNLDGTKGLIVDHGDVKNANVTYAFASAVEKT